MCCKEHACCLLLQTNTLKYNKETEEETDDKQMVHVSLFMRADTNNEATVILTRLNIY